MTNITIPAWLRITLYIVAGVGTPVLALLLHYGIIDSAELGLWSAVVAAIAAMAASHVTTAAVEDDSSPEGAAGLDDTTADTTTTAGDTDAG